MASRTEGTRVISQPTTDYYMTAFNVRKKPFDDIRVRQAVALAIDRKAVARRAYLHPFAGDILHRGAIGRRISPHCN